MLKGGSNLMPEGEPEMDAVERTRTGCSSQKWMPHKSKG